jgi:transcriptional regulator with GAF, ATPase, and Fis domain
MEGPMDRRALVQTLGEIAATAAETLDLQGVFDRVAASIREVIPFDHMGVVRLVGDDHAVMHATTVRVDACVDEPPAAEAPHPRPLTDWSPRIRPSLEPRPCVDEALEELDPDFPVDAKILAGGVRSSMWQPFSTRNGFVGGVWLASCEPGNFRDEHQEVLAPIAALLGAAVEHWRIWDAERRRRERLDRLETVLGALAESLDVREVFERTSEAVKPVLDHDVLVLTELEEDHQSYRLVAITGEHDAELPQGPMPLTEEEMASRLAEFEILDDIVTDMPPDSHRNRKVRESGMRSWLRVPVLLWGEVGGSLVFLHREAKRYGPEDVEVARRLADRIALVLSHQRLAEEARIAAQERERAERLEARVESLSRELESRQRVRIVGDSRSWKDVLRQVGRVAASETTVLLTGESGTGKEVISQLIHQGSPRSGRPFVAINCAALPDQLLESELFGHEKGAFTGAVASKIGRIEQAAGGTLFLDEIGETSPLVQAKLLRVLEEREFQRLGGTKTLAADVRVVTATNRHLATEIERGRFRADLYYRLAVFEISIPPLRERPEDVLLLAETFLEDLGKTMGRPAAGISRDARDWLLAYHWPGNVRELRNAIERAILLCDGGLVTREHLPAAVVGPGPGPGQGAGSGNGAAYPPTGSLDPEAPLPAGGVDLQDVEKVFVEKALKQTRGNKSRASRLLGITRAQLYSRIEKYGIR